MIKATFKFKGRDDYYTNYFSSMSKALHRLALICDDEFEITYLRIDEEIVKANDDISFL